MRWRLLHLLLAPDQVLTSQEWKRLGCPLRGAGMAGLGWGRAGDSCAPRWLPSASAATSQEKAFCISDFLLSRFMFYSSQDLPAVASLCFRWETGAGPSPRHPSRSALCSSVSFPFKIFLYFFERQSKRSGGGRRGEGSSMWLIPLPPHVASRAGPGLPLGCWDPGPESPTLPSQVLGSRTTRTATRAPLWGAWGLPVWQVSARALQRAPLCLVFPPWCVGAGAVCVSWPAFPVAGMKGIPAEKAAGSDRQ